MPRRSAFTLVELLVVIAIIGLLIALLLPAVQAAREAARRMQCLNNLKQMGIALHSHHSTFEYFPTSQTASGSSSGSDCEPGYYSWLVFLLPYMEEETLYDSIDLSANMSSLCTQGAPLEGGAPINADHVNANAAGTIVEAFLCPSDGGSVRNNASVMGSANPAGDNYAANAGWPTRATGYDDERPTPGVYNGFISLENPGAQIGWHPKGKISISKITDGTSHTAAVAERLRQTENSLDALLNSPDVVKSYHVTAVTRTLSRMASRCDSSFTHADAIQSAHLGRAWISGWTPTGPTYMHLKPPNTNHCHFITGSSHGDFAMTPTSNHPGGINLLLADGHVQFIPDVIEPNVWWALGSSNSNDLAESF